MPGPAAALMVGSTVVGGAMQSRAARKAASAQSRAADLGVAEQRRQFEAVQQLMAPYVQAGTGALGGQQALLGLSGPEAQAEAIAGIQAGPQFQAMVQQGEEALLQRASATGGLRGGNIQAALGQFRPQMLSDLVQQQYLNLGGLAAQGQAAAAGQAGMGMNAASNIANLYGQRGAAQAGGALGQAAAFAPLLSLPSQMAGMAAGAGQSFGDYWKGF